MWRPENREQVVAFVAAAAVAGGVAGWFGLGPLWAIAGVLAVPPLALAAWITLIAFSEPDPASHLRNQEPYRALTCWADTSVKHTLADGLAGCKLDGALR
jgi:hypothetical protein